MSTISFPTLPGPPSFAKNSDILGTSENAFSVIQFGDVPITAPLGTLADAVPYDVYLIDTLIRFESGLVQMPATGVEPSPNVSAVVQVSGGMTKMIVNWVAGRMGQPPVLPAYFTDNTNIIPLSGSILAKELITNADGSALSYLVSGCYVYAILDPSLFQLVPCVPPFLSNVVVQAARKAYTGWANLYQFQGATGANPFVPNGTTNGQTPQTPTDFISSSNNFIGADMQVVASVLNEPLGVGGQGSPSVPVVNP